MSVALEAAHGLRAAGMESLAVVCFDLTTTSGRRTFASLLALPSVNSDVPSDLLV